MSDAKNPSAGAGFPNFDFLQNLLQAGSPLSAQMPGAANWMAPSLNIEEIDKHIAELKAVHFWLEQNSKALAATVQALEVQKMTLTTLKGMNFDVSQIAKAFQPRAAAARPSSAAAAIDPLQMWSALTEQFGNIAASAVPGTAAATPKSAAERKTVKRPRRT